MKNLLVKILAIIIIFTTAVPTAFSWGFKDLDALYTKEDDTPQYTRVAAAHILVRTAADAVMIKKELENGGSFEYYARKYSLCPSKERGGYLGYFERGQMVPEFEKKAFAMEIGEISNPVRTNFGWHIIKIIDKQ